MRPGGGKAKGSDFERSVCKDLSLWVSDGKHVDLFWRSAMSGGRATVSRGLVRQAGDICAVAEEGHWLTNLFYIECKAYSDLTITSFLLRDSGTLKGFWEKACAESEKYRRTPIMICRQNLFPAFIMAPYRSPFRKLTDVAPIASFYRSDTDIWDYRMVMDSPCLDSPEGLKKLLRTGF